MRISGRAGPVGETGRGPRALLLRRVINSGGTACQGPGITAGNFAVVGQSRGLARSEKMSLALAYSQLQRTSRVNRIAIGPAPHEGKSSTTIAGSSGGQ